MPRTIQQLTVFVAWPGDAGKERDLVFKAVGRIDRTLGKQYDARVEAVDWKTVARPGQGRPQGRINDAVKGYDIFVGVLNLSIGSEAGMGMTGFEEEFSLADEAWRTGKKKGKGPSLLLYFRSRVTVNTDSLKPEQIARVQAFKQERIKRKTLLFGEYRSLTDFEDQVHDALYDEIVVRLGKMAVAPSVSRAAPAPRPKPAGKKPTARPSPAKKPAEPAAASPKPAMAPKRSRGAKALPIEKIRPLLTDEKREAYARRVFNSLFQTLSKTAAAFDRDHAHATLKTTQGSADAFDIQGQVEGHTAVHFRVALGKGNWPGRWQILLHEASGTSYGGSPYFSAVETVRTASDDYTNRLEDDTSRYAFTSQEQAAPTPASVADRFWKRINTALKVRR